MKKNSKIIAKKKNKHCNQIKQMQNKNTKCKNNATKCKQL
jgi:hypothetical protein